MSLNVHQRCMALINSHLQWAEEENPCKNMCKLVRHDYHRAACNGWEVSPALTFPHKLKMWRAVLICHQDDACRFLPGRTLKHQIIWPNKSSSFSASVVLCSTCFQISDLSFLIPFFIFFKFMLQPFKRRWPSPVSSCLCQVFPSPVFSNPITFCFPESPCFPSSAIHPLVLQLISSPLRPSQPLLAWPLHCFDIWPNYLANWSSCNCHTVWWWGSISCCLYHICEGHGPCHRSPIFLSLCTVWITGKGTVTA